MNLLISVKKAIVSGTTYTLGTDNFIYTVKIQGLTIYSADPQSGIIGAGNTHDGKGCAIPYTFTASGSINEDLLLNLNFNNPYDYVDVEIDISLTGYKTYNKIIRVYGIDLTIPIVMLEDADNGSFNILTHVEVIRPLSSLVYIYRTTNAEYDTIDYLNTLGVSISSLEDFILNVTSLNQFRCETSVAATTDIEASYTSLNKINWMPEIGISVDCNLQCNDCFTKLSDNIIHMYVNNINITPILINGLTYTYGIWDWYGVTFSLVDSSNLIKYTYTYAYSNPNLVDYIKASDTFQLNDIGDFKAIVELQVLGDYYKAATASIDPNLYYVLNDAGDISNFTYTGTYAEFDTVDITVGGVPNSQGMVLIPKYDTSNANTISNSYIKVLNDTNVEFNSVATAFGDFYYLNPNDVLDIATGTGFVLPILPYYSCYTSTTIKGCEVYDVQQSACDSYNIINRGLTSQTFNVYKLETTYDDSWELKAEDVNVAAGSYSTLQFTTDGVYKVEIDDVTLIIVSMCEIENCKLNFLKKLMCCEDTNCSSTDHIKYNGRDYFNYNAFILIVHNLYHILNLSYGYYESFTTITESQLQTFYEINDLISRAKDYCGDCAICNN